jgi:hypothetical protein
MAVTRAEQRAVAAADALREAESVRAQLAAVLEERTRILNQVRADLQETKQKLEQTEQTLQQLRAQQEHERCAAADQLAAVVATERAEARREREVLEEKLRLAEAARQREVERSDAQEAHWIQEMDQTRTAARAAAEAGERREQRWAADLKLLREQLQVAVETAVASERAQMKSEARARAVEAQREVLQSELDRIRTTEAELRRTLEARARAEERLRQQVWREALQAVGRGYQPPTKRGGQAIKDLVHQLISQGPPVLEDTGST